MSALNSQPQAARSWLFVPGNRPDRFVKASASGADVIIVDLEDAVPAAEKASARASAATWLASGGSAAVRVNPAASEHHAADLAALAGLPGLVAAVLPMTSSPDDVASARRRLGERVALIPQIETAAGLLRAVELASAPGVARLAFGHLDFAFDIDAVPSRSALEHARSSLVVASRAAGVAGPVDSVTTDLDDPAVTRADALHARELGFTAKLCIHPRQVAAVNEAMSPSGEEVGWARQVLSGGSTGAVRVDGQMVDAPVLARAERVLARAGGTEDGRTLS